MPISSGVTGLSSGEGGWAHDHALVRACRRARRLAIRCWASELGDSLHGVQALRRRRDGAWPPLRFVPARWSWVGGLVRGTLLPLLLPVHSRALTHPQSLIGASAPNLLVDIFAAASTSKAGQWKPWKKARQFRWQAVVWLIWMKRRRKYVGCSIERGGGYLRLCYRWQNKRLALTKRMPDTPENHARLDKLAGVVAAAIKAGKDPRVLLQEATPSNAKDYPTTITVADYFEKWIADKVPPLVRKAQARDYPEGWASLVKDSRLTALTASSRPWRAAWRRLPTTFLTVRAVASSKGSTTRSRSSSGAARDLQPCTSLSTAPP